MTQAFWSEIHGWWQRIFEEEDRRQREVEDRWDRLWWAEAVPIYHATRLDMGIDPDGDPEAVAAFTFDVELPRGS